MIRQTDRVAEVQMATGAPPYADLHPMRVLFLIPKSPAPELEGPFSPEFKDFVGVCLQKVGGGLPCCITFMHNYVHGQRQHAFHALQIAALGATCNFVKLEYAG